MKPSKPLPRTPMGNAYRGTYTHAQRLGHAVAAALARAGLEPAEINDGIADAAMQQDSTPHSRDQPGIPDHRLNGNGGAIAVGRADRRSAAMGASGLFEMF